MRKPLRMDIMKPSQHLLKVVTADRLAKGTRVENVVEKFTSQDWFLRNIRHWHVLTTALFPDRLFLELVILDDMFVI